MNLEPSSNRGFYSHIRTWGKRVLALIAFLTAVIGFSKLLSADTKYLREATIIGVVVILWLALLYVRRKTESGKRIIHLPTGEHPIVKHEFSRTARRFALVGVISLPLFTVLGFAILSYVKNPRTTEILILIADFEGPAPSNYRVTESLLEHLQTATREYPEVQVKALGKAITARDGSEMARSIGKQESATMLLWGWYGKTTDKAMINLHIEILGDPKYLELRNDRQLLTVPVADLESFNVQLSLSKEMSYLTLLILGLVRYEAKDYDGAIARLTRAMNQPAQPTEIVSPHILYLYRGLAYALKADEACIPVNYDLAISDFGQVISFMPQNTNAYLNRGIILTKRGDYDHALADFEKARVIAPNEPSIFHSLGQAYIQKGNLDRAISEFDRAIELDPNSPLPYLSRGFAYVEKDDYERALTDCNKALEIESSNAISYHTRGLVYLKKGDLELALADINKSIVLAPTDADCYVSRGLVYAAKRDYERAMKEVNYAISLQPTCHKSAAFYVARALIHRLKMDDTHALEDVGTAIALDSKMAYAYYLRGKVYLDLKNVDAAMTDFDRAIGMGAAFSDAFIARGSLHYMRAVAGRLAQLARRMPQNSEKKDFTQELSEYLIDEFQSGSFMYDVDLTTLDPTAETDKAIADFEFALGINKRAEIYFKCGLAYQLKGDAESARTRFVYALEYTNDETLRGKINHALEKLSK